MKKVMTAFLVVLLAGVWGGAAADTEPLNDLFERVSPSVVVIQILEKGPETTSGTTTVSVGGLGSGVVISKDGLILTAAHVVQVANAIQVLFQSGERISAKIIGSSVAGDVALIKLDKVPRNLAVATLADSDLVRVGDPLFVVGAPYGIDNTLTVGYVSGKRKPAGLVDRFLQVELIQTDAAINRGNSGGPMFNMAGEVIGIVSNILSKSGGFEGIGFAVSINTTKALLIDGVSVWTGLETFMLTDGLARAFNVPQEMGLLVTKVADMSPGYYLGLKGGTFSVSVNDQDIYFGGDIILSVDGLEITDSLERLSAIRKNLAEHPNLRDISVTILRSGQVLVLRRSN